jgi:hypothetical protein
MGSLFLSFVTSLLFLATAFASPQAVRWDFETSRESAFPKIVESLNQQTGGNFTPQDFLQAESLDQANSHFTMYYQVKNGLPIQGHTTRIWTRRDNNELIQVEAVVDLQEKSTHRKSDLLFVESARESFSQSDTLALARKIAGQHRDDKMIKDVSWKDFWKDGKVVREITAKAKHGKHLIVFNLEEQKVLSSRYVEYPQAEYFSVPAKVYPIYEETEGLIGTILPRIESELRYLKTTVPLIDGNPYAPLQQKRYFYSKLDPILGETPEGQAQGLWSIKAVKKEARQILNSLPLGANNNGQILLDGKYATISIHPMAVKAYPNLNFTPALSTQYKLDWIEAPNNDYEMIINTSYYGRPLLSADDIWNLEATRRPNHDPASYINDGFDQIQVYWAINTFFESLGAMGFTDPEFSTRPFNAFLYDPDISMRDNAYYTDDTINFTTYSPDAPNYARDNSTIWHELGHGLMDRLMGDMLNLADTGGLSEGIADLVGQMLTTDVMWGQTFPGQEGFRIINKTGFYLTNEVHDDGESYGGAMYDMMAEVIRLGGKPGLVKFTNLVLESMRLTRNNPALTANDWFTHMLFADHLGAPGLRSKDEMKDIILQALANRNFSMEGASPAKMEVVVNGNQELDSSGPWSRSNPVQHRLKADEVVDYKISVSLEESSFYKFRFPVTVKFSFNGGPLQGAIHWENEERGAKTMVLKSPYETATMNLAATGKCDFLNREDGSCNDFVYIQIINDGEQRPQAKKRFYLRVYPQP